MVTTNVVLFALFTVTYAEVCPPTTQTYCLEGREGYNSLINGEYVYEGCNSNMPYFRNQNRNDENLYLFFHDSDTILIGPDYTTTSANAACEASSLQNCNQNWNVFDGSSWTNEVDSAIYFGSDCDYARSTASLCTELTEVSITVAFDSTNLSDTYQVAGCYDSQPHLTNGDFFIYYNYDSSTYYLSDTFSDTTNVKATCDLSIYTSITHCFFVPSDIEHSVSLDIQLSDDSFPYMLYVGFPLSIIFFIIIIALMISAKKALQHQLSQKSTEAQITNNSNNIEMTQRSEIKQKATQNEEDTAPKKWTIKFIAKCVFVFLIKPALEIYDYYTDFTLALIWMDLRLLDNKCPVYYGKYAYPLLITSSLGFAIGVIGHIYSVSHAYCVNKRLSYHSLSNLKQSNVNYCVWAKMFLEDIVAIIIFLIVSENEIGITDNKWWLAYYSSCCSLMLSAILLMRKIVPTINGKINGRTYIMIGFLVGAPFGLPLYPSGKTEYRSNLRLGFALNDDECQLFANDDGTYLTFDVQHNGLYSVYCGAIFDRSRTIFSYDEGEYSGLYCNLYRSSSDNEVACKFSILEHKCWTGNCEPYNSNITACFGYIGLE